MRATVRWTFPLLLLMALSGCRSGSDWGELVRAVERQPGMERQYIPMLGLARTAVRTTNPSGIRDLRLAVFNNRGGLLAADAALENAMISVSQRGWSPMIRISESSGARTTIWARPKADGVEMLLLVREADEAVVIQLEMDPERFFDSLEDPASIRKVAEEEAG